MRSLLNANVGALLGETVFPRDFIEIAAKNRDTGSVVYERLWSDIFDVSAQVFDPITESTVTKAFAGAGGLVESAEGIPMVSDLTVQEVTLNFAAYGDDVDRILRLYDVKGAQIIIWRGFLNVETRLMVAPAETIFIGEINTVSLPTGEDGSEQYSQVVCVSSQELTRSNPETRSDASQRRRSTGDTFFKYAAAVPDWTMWWGQKRANLDTGRRGRQAAANSDSGDG